MSKVLLGAKIRYVYLNFPASLDLQGKFKIQRDDSKFVKGNTQFVRGVPDNIVGEINCRMEICKFLPCYHSIPDRGGR